MRVYLDESIHDSLGFIASAMVFDRGEVVSLVEQALLAERLVPYSDEFKSSARMHYNTKLRDLRDRLLQVAGREVYLAVIFTSAGERKHLGEYVLQCLLEVCIRNGVNVKALEAYFDRGIFSSLKQAESLLSRISRLSEVACHFEQDSKKILGIQVADAVAHSLGQVIRQDLMSNPKQIALGQESGYPDGTMVDLSWSLLMNLRYTLFHRKVFYESERNNIDPELHAKFIGEEEDIVTHAQHPDLYGWGVFISPRLKSRVREAIQGRFAAIWLGCIH